MIPIMPRTQPGQQRRGVRSNLQRAPETRLAWLAPPESVDQMLAIRSALAMAASDGLTAPLLWKKLLSLTYELLGHGLYTVDQAHSTPDQRQSARVLPELSKPCSGTVELRGLEPLTFSLRRLRPAGNPSFADVRVGASGACTA